MRTISYFPHMVITNVQKISTDIEEQNIVSHDIQLSSILSEFIAAKNEKKNLEVLESIAKGKVEAASVILSRSELLEVFPEFDKILEQLSEVVSLVSPSTEVLKVIKNESKFWDSLIVHFILNEDIAFINDLTLAVKVVGFLKWWEKCGIDKLGDAIAFWRASYVQFPSSIFPLPKRTTTSLVGNPPDVEVVNTGEILADIAKLEAAREDIVTVFKLQVSQARRELRSKAEFKAALDITLDNDLDKQDNKAKTVRIKLNDEYNSYASQVFPDELSMDSVEKLQGPTMELLRSKKIETDIQVPYVLKRLDKFIQSRTAQLKPELAQQQMVLIGNRLITIEAAVYEDIICLTTGPISHCELLQQLSKNNPDRTYVQVLGTGYANIIRQELVRYEADEIAHIENVLQGEHKEKTHRNLKTTEDFFSIETERTEETETDTKTTDRFSLSKEVGKAIASSSSFEAGLNVSASYGPVSFGANLGYTSTNSSSEATSLSVSNSREVTERAVSRIQERSLEIRSNRSINEIEVTNVHGINNADGDEHISGFYYWVDKVYKNQIFNIGKRLMLEFMIPEPAAHYIFSKTFSRSEGVKITKPIDPAEYVSNAITTPLRSHKDITRANYHLWGALYNSQEIVVPPEDTIIVSNSYASDYVPNGKTYHAASYKDLEIKEGYEANIGYLNFGFSGGSGRYISGFLGNVRFSGSSNTSSPIIIALNGETGTVPFSHRSHVNAYHFNVEILCTLKDTGFENWQLEMYNAIIRAYELRLLEYNSAVASVESAVKISGQNPLLNRKTEQTELKKWSIELLTLQRFDGFNAMQRASNGAPEMHFGQALQEGKFVKFFEQAIEWHNMTYLFYPYFWANKLRWTTVSQLGDTDQKFTDFLQAGYARVVVPVSPKFTDSILHYLNSGEIWQGGELPTIDDSLYISVVDEIKAAEAREDDEPVGDPWETRVPTNLVMLTDEIPGDLPGSGS